MERRERNAKSGGTPAWKGIGEKAMKTQFRPKVVAVSANGGGLDLGLLARRIGFGELAEFFKASAWDKIA